MREKIRNNYEAKKKKKNSRMEKYMRTQRKDSMYHILLNHCRILLLISIKIDNVTTDTLAYITHFK